MSRWFGLLFLALAACGADSEGTPGKRIVLHTRAAVEPKVATTFTTGFGWDVTLTKATVSIAGLYYFDGPPPTAMVGPRSFEDRFAGLFIGTAWAHPGHYQAGSALGQVAFTQPVTLDLFGPTPIALPDGEGVTGTYRSARVVLPTTGQVGTVEGRAVKHDGSSPAPIFFRLIADFADVAGSIKNGAVDGCALEETNVTDAGTITVLVKPSIWLNLVDFAKLAPGSAESPTEAHDSGFSQGVTQLSAYAFNYAK